MMFYIDLFYALFYLIYLVLVWPPLVRQLSNLGHLNAKKWPNSDKIPPTVHGVKCLPCYCYEITYYYSPPLTALP